MQGHDYKKWETDLRLPRGQWVELGRVDAVSGEYGLYVMQFLVRGLNPLRTRAGVLRVHFDRNNRDGTGNQDFVLPRSQRSFLVDHNHAVSGFPGFMASKVWTDLSGLTVAYRILKSLK